MPDAVQAQSRAGGRAGGVIHDLGYRGYDGPRLGRAQIVRALTWHSFRSAYGIGRGVKGKIIPVLAFIAMCLPALVNAFAVARGNQRLFGYDVYTPGLRVALVSCQMAEPPLADTIVPRYSTSSGTSIRTSSAPVIARYLASG